MMLILLPLFYSQIFAMEDFTIRFGIQREEGGKLIDTGDGANIKGWVCRVMRLGKSVT
jgi:hypothetical protein